MGKKGKDQRTKNNARPSNSGRSAELLGNSTFFGFSAGKDTSIGFVTEEIDSSVDPNFSLLLKKMTKKDATTKLKALQEFSELVKASDVDVLKAVLPFWPRAFCALAGDGDHRVREAVHQTQGQVVAKAGRNIAPHLKQIIAAWFVGQCDGHAPAASAARASLGAAFPGHKMADALAFCQLEILAFLSASLSAPPPPAKSEDGEAIALYHRRLSSSLQGYALYLRTLPPAKLELALDANREIVASKSFKKLAKFAAPQVCAAWFKAAAALSCALPALAIEQVSALSAALIALDERDSAALAAAWEAALCLACAVPDCWSHVSLEKAVLPKLWHVLREGCYGNAGTVLPSLLPLISKIPVADDAAKAVFYDRLFDSLRSGSRCRGVLASRGEMAAVVRCYLECLGFCLMCAQNDSDLCTRLIHTHLGALVSVTLTSEPAGPLAAALAPALSALVSGWEAAGRTAWAEATLAALACAAMPAPDWALSRQVDLCLAMLAPARKPAKGCRVRFQRDADESQLATAAAPLRSSAELCVLSCAVAGALVDVTRAEQSPRALMQLARLMAVAGKTLAEFLHTAQIPTPPQTSSAATQDRKSTRPATQDAHDQQSAATDSAHAESPACLDELPDAAANTAATQTTQQPEPARERVPLALLVCAWLREKSTCGAAAVEVALAALPHLADEEHHRVVQALEELLSGPLAAACLSAAASRCANTRIAQVLRGQPACAALSTILHAACAGSEQTGQLGALRACIEARDERGAAVLPAETLRDFGAAAAASCTDPIGGDTAQSMLALIAVASEDDRLLPPLLRACLARPSPPTTLQALDVGARRSAADPETMGRLVRCAAEELRRPLDSLELPELSRYVSVAWLVSGQSQASVDQLLDRLGARLMPIEARLAPLGVPQGAGLGPSCAAEDDCDDSDQQELSLTRSLEVYLNHSLFATCLVQKMLPKGEEQIKVADEAEKEQTREEYDELEVENSIQFEDIKSELPTDGPIDELSSGDCGSKSDVDETESQLSEAVQCVDIAKTLEETETDLPSGVDSEGVRARDLETAAEDSEQIPDVRGHLLRAQVCAALCHTLKTTYATSVYTAALAPRILRFQQEFQRMVLAVPRAQADYALTAYALTPVTLPRGCLEEERIVAAHAASAVLAARAGAETAAPDDRAEFPAEHEMPAKPDMLYNCEAWRKSRETTAAAASVARRLTNWLRAETASQATPPTAQMDLVFVGLASWCETVRNSRRFLLAECATSLPLLPVEHPEATLRYSTPDAECNDNATLLAIHTCRLATALFRYLALPVEHLDDASGGKEAREAQAADWKAVFASDVTALLENTFVLLADACGRGELSLLDLPLVGAVCEAVRGMPAELPAAATSHAALAAVASRVPELQIAAAAMLAPPSASATETDRASAWRSTLAALSVLEPVVGAALEGVRRGQTQRFGLHAPHAAEVRGFLLVWAAALRTCDAADPEQRSALATDLREGGHIAGLLTHVFRLMPNEALHGAKPRSCAALFDSAPELEPATCGERAVEHLACHVFALALAALPAEVRGWWQSERCCSLVERVTMRHAAHSLVERQMRQVAARAAREPLHNMTIRVLSGARELSAVYTVDEAKTELVITLPANYPLQPVKVEAPGGVASSAQSRAWLMQLALFLTCQNGSLWDGLSMWKAKLDKRFDGVEECYICFAVLSAAGCQLPKVCCRTCKKKFHSACLFKWFTTSNKSTCPICRNLF